MEDDFVAEPGSQGDPAGPAPAGSPQPNPSAGAPAGDGAPAADPAAAGGQPPKGYIPAYRLQQVTERYNRLEQAYRQLAARMDAPQPAGQPAAPAAQPTAEEQIIRDQFFKLFPWAKALHENPALLEQIPRITEAVSQSQAQQDHYWQAHGQAFLSELRSEAKKLYGDDVSPKVLRTLEIGFYDLIESDPDARARYLNGDRALVADYWKDISTALYDPIRRRAAAEQQRRGEAIRRVPSAGPGSQALGRGAGQPKPKTEEELHDRAWAALENAGR